jgi:two-component system, cell cycle sensor histidine kinase and response regulator CckA
MTMRQNSEGIGVQLEQTAAALREREEFVRLLLDSTAEAILGLDLEGNCTFCNAATLRMLGYASAQELMGRNLHNLIHHSRENGLPFPQEDCAVFGGTRRGEGVHVSDEVIWRKDGTFLAVEYWSYPIRRDGEVIGAVFTFIDVSERRRLEAQLHQAQKMDAIGTLAGGVAHDFNNLLLVIGAYAELMLDSLEAGHPLRRNVKEILGAAHRAADLTRQLLAFSRKQMQALQILDLNSVLQEISKMLPRLIGEDIQLQISPEEGLHKVKADPGQIEQIVMNLAANARDAMTNGGRLTIQTKNITLDEAYAHHHTVVPAGEYVMLAVTDSGEGIPAEHLPHIFEPFYTTKGAGKGTGLGLATAYGIVKQSGGFIWVYSELGLGTTFKIYLPVVYAKPKLRVAPPVETTTRGTETILLVEDEVAVRRSTREFLSLNGYTVIEAANGVEALQTSREYPGKIDILVTDVVMPQMGGAQVAETLAMERPMTRVLFVSGYAENTILQHGVIDMSKGFLQKPFTLKGLARKIREVLEARASAASSSG